MTMRVSIKDVEIVILKAELLKAQTDVPLSFKNCLRKMQNWGPRLLHYKNNQLRTMMTQMLDLPSLFNPLPISLPLIVVLVVSPLCFCVAHLQWFSKLSLTLMYWLLFMFCNESYSYFVLANVYCLLFFLILDCHRDMILHDCRIGIVSLLFLFFMMPKRGDFYALVCIIQGEHANQGL